MLKLGDTVIPYHEDFRMYITTKLPNPHYTPEIASKLTLINFTLSPRSAPRPPPWSISSASAGPATPRPGLWVFTQLRGSASFLPVTWTF